MAGQHHKKLLHHILRKEQKWNQVVKYITSSILTGQEVNAISCCGPMKTMKAVCHDIRGKRHGMGNVQMASKPARQFGHGQTSKSNETFKSNRKAAKQLSNCTLLWVTKNSESNKKLPDNDFHLLFSVKKCWSRLKIFSEDISYGFDQEETGFYLICHVSSKGNVYLYYIYP